MVYCIIHLWQTMYFLPWINQVVFVSCVYMYVGMYLNINRYNEKAFTKMKELHLAAPESKAFILMN